MRFFSTGFIAGCTLWVCLSTDATHANTPATGDTNVDFVDGPTGTPEGSFLYENFCSAQAILNSAIETHGGTEWVEGAINIRARSSGHFYYQAHYARPWTHHDYVLEGSLLYSGELRAFRKVEHYNYNRPLEGFTLLSLDRGLVLVSGSEEAETLVGDELQERWAGELEVFPHEFLRQATASAASLRLLGSHEGQDVLHYQHAEEEARALYIDQKTHLLSRVERIGHWKLKGDRLEWTSFSDYRELDGRQLAYSIRSHSEHFGEQSDTQLQLDDVTIGGPIEAADFCVPAAKREAHGDFVVTEPEEVVFEPLPSHDLGLGVYIIDVPELDARSMLVEFAEFTVIIEGGDHSAISERILRTAELLCPQKPVRYVAMSHHHPLYTGGIRSYVNQGVTVLSTPGNVEYIRNLVTRPYRIEPDAQQLAPRAPMFELVGEVKVIEDATQRLELHAFDSSTHTDEYVLTFVPSLKLGFLGDLVYSKKSGQEGPARGRTRAVFNLINDRALDIEQLSQTWYLEKGKMLYPYSEIIDERAPC